MYFVQLHFLDGFCLFDLTKACCILRNWNVNFSWLAIMNQFVQLIPKPARWYIFNVICKLITHCYKLSITIVTCTWIFEYSALCLATILFCVAVNVLFQVLFHILIKFACMKKWMISINPWFNNFTVLNILDLVI